MREGRREGGRGVGREEQRYKYNVETQEDREGVRRDRVRMGKGREGGKKEEREGGNQEEKEKRYIGNRENERGWICICIEICLFNLHEDIRVLVGGFLLLLKEEEPHTIRKM